MDTTADNYSPKARATRNALLAAARRVMARDGYRNARIADIAHEAGKSVGVFYTYFHDKGEAFAALVDEFYRELVEVTPAAGAYEANTGPAIRTAIRLYWETYGKFHSELAGLYEVALTDPSLLAVWQKIRQAGVRRFAFRIRKEQEKGKCRGLDPELAGSALIGMLEFACFNWQSRKLDFPNTSVSDERAVETIFQLYCRAIELCTDDDRPAP